MYFLEGCFICVLLVLFNYSIKISAKIIEGELNTTEVIIPYSTAFYLIT
jgi:hypothetical protein